MLHRIFRIQPRHLRQRPYFPVDKFHAFAVEYFTLTFHLYISESILRLLIVPFTVKIKAYLHRFTRCNLFLQIPRRELEIIILPDVYRIVT